MNIESQVAELGSGPLTADGIKTHIWPLFTRSLAGDRARGEIYLANHSLGRPLDQMAIDVMAGLDVWYSRMDGAWSQDAWFGEMNLYRSHIAKLIGLADSTAVVPRTSAGQGLRSVLNALPRDGSTRPVRVLATQGEFDSIDFILKTYAKKGRVQVDWVSVIELESNTERILDAIQSGVDLVVISMVLFATGEVLNGLDRIIEKAHSVGALVLLDSYHAAGVIPIDMMQLNADFMIGGSYKYTRGGPGACWLALHPRLLDGDLATLDTGWFAKKDPFLYERPDLPILSEGGDSWLESTPPVLIYYQARSGLAFTLAIGVDRLRKYNLSQQQLLREAFKDKGVECVVPKHPERYGAFTLVPSPNASLLVKELKAAGVNTDSRGRFVRFGPDILNTQEELLNAAKITCAIVRKPNA